MGQAGRWSAVGVASLAVFGLCVWLADAVLPWERPERIATGAGAGAVLAAVLVAWAVWRLGSPAPPAPPPASGGPAASGGRSVAVGGDNSGTVVTGDGNTVQR
ncbi:hypothetical protein ACFSJS_22865 [Streptomyces desertarenae]|uniref:Uncharacterized protein n=1 Tax=Streptomyces desertarenae TaxID=2666184 RepID=A0ABW4PR29_9ACTN